MYTPDTVTTSDAVVDWGEKTKRAGYRGGPNRTAYDRLQQRRKLYYMLSTHYYILYCKLYYMLYYRLYYPWRCQPTGHFLCK